MVRETDGGSEQERDYIYLIKIPLGDQLSEGGSILFASEMYFLINSIQAPLCYNNM